MSKRGDFYEEDEPVADVVAAFEAGQPVVSVAPPPSTVGAPVKVTEHRTVAAERDLPRVRQWVEDAVRHSVNEAAQALNAVRYWCEQTEAHIAEHEANEGADRKCDFCKALEMAVAQVRALLPDLSPVGADSAGGGEDMGTRVTKPLGGDADGAAFDRDWLTNGNGGN